MRFVLIVLVVQFTAFSGFAQKFATKYEKSGFKETTTYDETIDYCKKLARHSDKLHYATFGKSSRGYDLPYMIADKQGLSDPDKIKESGRTVLMVQCGIHPGESEGKDAMMMLLRDAFIEGEKKGLFEEVSVVWIPVFNADGDHRFGPYGRINQNGPEEMGWRVNSRNLNLNRDYLKADTPEMRHWLDLWSKWLPDFFIDCHTTDGADYQYVLTYAMEILGQMDKELTQWQKEEYIDEVMPKMFEAGFPVFQYVSFRNWHDPRSGMKTEIAPPRISQGYTALQNRPGLLVETHMLKPYKPRVESTYKLIELSMDLLNEKGEKLQQLNRKADKQVASKNFREKPLTIDYKLSQKDSTIVDFLGIDYEVEKSDLTGGNWYKYQKGEEKTFQLTWFKHNIPEKKIQLPEAYLIPPEWTNVIKRLKAHGVEMFQLEEKDSLKVQMYDFTDYSWRNRPYEGRMVMTSRDYKNITRKRFFPEGTYVIPTSQRTARVIAHALEPSAPDSYVYWGMFNAIFEQKEYAETYVMEKKARKMLEENPELREQFEKWKKQNPKAAQSQWAQLNWFYKKTPWWDEEKDLYPVGRLMDLQQLERKPDI